MTASTILKTLFIVSMTVTLGIPAVATIVGPPSPRPVRHVADDSTPRGPAPITRAQYLQLEMGMTSGDVAAMLGRDGKETARSQFGDTITLLATWQNPGGGGISATFQAAGSTSTFRLVSKAQVGLE